MNNKLTKEQLLTALMIRFDQLESKIDKLLGILDIPVAQESEIDKLIQQRDVIVESGLSDDEYFGEVYK